MNPDSKEKTGNPRNIGLFFRERILPLATRDRMNIIIPALISIFLLVFFFLFYDLNFLAENGKAAVEYLLTFYILIFILIAGIGMIKIIPDIWFNVFVFMISFAFFILMFGNVLALYSLGGDNLCQVAYWNILFKPNLAGSIGASLTKPGQVVISGIFYLLSLVIGDWAFKIGLCLVMACCVFSLVRISTDIGGRIAGVITFFITQWAFFDYFAGGEAVMYFIPVLFTGLWLYFTKPKLKMPGLVLLVFSIQFNIQSVAILGIIWWMHLLKREWKDLVLLSAFTFVSVVIWMLFILRVQGSFSRLDSGGGVGYVGDLMGFESGYVDNNKVAYMLNMIRMEWSYNLQMRFLLILSLFGIAGTFFYKQKKYLVVFGVIVILVLNVLILGGTLNFGRYFAVVYGFSCSIGVAVSVRFISELFKKKRIVPIVLSVIVMLQLLMIFNFGYLNAFKSLFPGMEAPFVSSAFKLMEDPKLPQHVRLMSEDDLLYPVVVHSPDRFTRLHALQHFNILPESKRKEILGDTDYIWIQIINEHCYHYLFHLPVEAWLVDPFRVMVERIIESNRAESIYGYNLVPVDKNEERLILKVEPLL